MSDSDGIRCPICGGATGVSETRSTTGQIRRRRRCDNLACGGRVTTVEMPVYGTARGVKLGGDAIMIRRGALEHLRAAYAALGEALSVDGAEDE